MLRMGARESIYVGILLILVLRAGIMTDRTTAGPLEARDGSIQEFCKLHGVRNVREYWKKEIALGHSPEEIRLKFELEALGIHPLSQEPATGWTEEVVIERLKKAALERTGHSAILPLLSTLSTIGRERALRFLSHSESLELLKLDESLVRDHRARIEFRISPLPEKRSIAFKMLAEGTKPGSRAIQLAGYLGSVESLPAIEAILADKELGTSDSEEAKVARIEIDLQQRLSRPQAYMRAAECNGKLGHDHRYSGEVCPVRRWGIWMMGDDQTPETTEFLKERVNAYHGGAGREFVRTLYNLQQGSSLDVDHLHCAMEEVLDRLEGRKFDCQDCRTDHRMWGIDFRAW